MSLPPPRERLVTLPDEPPALSLGWGVAAWMIDNLVQPNGPRAGEPFIPTEGQLEFLLNFYGLNEDGLFLYKHAARRLPKGSGKGETLDGMIPTVDGWRRFGDLKVGDRVFGRDGSPTTVIQVHPVYDGPAYKVCISDGTEMIVSDEHLFTVNEFVGGPNRVERTYSVLEMKAKGLKYRRPLTKGRTKAVNPDVSRFALPEAEPFIMPEADLPVDPHLLGYWIGDGDSGAGSISFDDRDFHNLERVANHAGYRVSPNWRRNDSEHGATATVLGLVKDLRAAGVLGDKHIPNAYLMASVEQRLALLRGLMDSDGYVDTKGNCEFCTVRADLAEQVAELIRGLGYKVNVKESDAKLYSRVTGKRYRLSFKAYAHRNPFSLPRKSGRVPEMKRVPIPRVITGIERVPYVPTRCITVDAPDGLYVTGRTRVVTHNSPFAAAVALAELLGPVRLDRIDPSAPFGVVGKPMAMPLVHIVATSEAQTMNTMRMVMAFCSKGSKLAKKYDLDVAKTKIDTPGMGLLTQVTSAPHTLEGAEISFACGDETEHWVPSRNGPELLAVEKRNAGKSPGARVMETSNAWVPGEGSVAEATYEDWCDQEEGKTRDEFKILYDARIAPPNTVLHDDPESDQVSLTEALKHVYADCPWKFEPGQFEAIKSQIWTGSFSESDSWRFYMNRPTAADNAWVPLEEWVQLVDRDRKVEDGEPIVMFFDGSKSNDHTALVGCCMKDGHIFKIGHWAPEKTTGSVNVGAVDAGVRQAFERWDVVAFWADVREWESFTRVSWPEAFGDGLICPAVLGGMNASPIAWDMRSHAYQFAEAAEAAFNEIQEKTFTHDGDGELGVHVSNCRTSEFRGRFSVKKESPKSPKKIDLAVCMIGARMLYRHVKASKEWADRSKPKGGVVFL